MNGYDATAITEDRAALRSPPKAQNALMAEHKHRVALPTLAVIYELPCGKAMLSPKKR